MLQIKSNVMPSGVEAQAKTPFNSQITHLPTHRDNPKTNSILFYFACPEHSRRFFWTGKKSRYTTKLKTKNQQLKTKPYSFTTLKVSTRSPTKTRTKYSPEAKPDKSIVSVKALEVF